MADITVQELKQRLDNGEKLNIVDVRETIEHEVSKITDLLLPTSDPEAMLNGLEPFRNEEVIIHCRSGARSGRVVEYLKGLGFTNARNMVGGMKAWQAEIDPQMPVA